MIRESRVIQTIYSELNKRSDIWYMNIHGNELQKNALDLIICYKSYFISLEVKRPNGRFREHQPLTIAKIREAHGIAAKVENVKEVIAILDFVDKLILPEPMDYTEIDGNDSIPLLHMKDGQIP